MIKRDKPARSFETALLVGAWAVGAFIYGWLFAGLLNERDYPNLTLSSALGMSDLAIALLGGVVAGGVAWLFRRKKTSNSDSNRLFRIVVAVLPALFVVSALATLVLTLATYNGYWVEARQGLATAFAALIAAVGVVVSVAVSYQTGEENRLAQQENLKTQLESQQKNLETQLEHQRTLEAEKGTREQQKLDAELIKNLNDRLHEIIPRRYGSRPAEVSASYFQLAALYRDWETLATASDLIGRQKKSQQRNILKLLFGVYQEQAQAKEAGDVDNSVPHKSARRTEPDPENKPASRSQVDIRTLNSVIQDIFADYRKDKKKLSEAQDEELMDKDPDSVQYSYDLSYLDLRDLDLSQKDLSHAILKGARLECASLWDARLEGANLMFAHLEGANLEDAVLEGAYLWGAVLEGAYLRGAVLEGANLMGAHLEGANLMGAHLEDAHLVDAHLEGGNLLAAHMEGANLVGAYLEGAHLEGARLEGADLWSACLEGTNLRGTNLRGASLEGAYLSDAHLKDTDLRGTHLRNTSFFGFRESSQDTSAREGVINQLKEARYLPNRDELLKAQGFDQALVDDIIKAHEAHHKEDQQ